MKLYHGSLEQVAQPEIREANRTLDYGKGFYATTSFEQAENWVRRKAQEMKVGKGYVNVYGLDESALRKTKSLVFNQPTDEWVDFVHQNRTVKGFQHDYDIVYGPVANDRPKGYNAQTQVAKEGGSVAKAAHKQLESKLGRSVISKSKASDYLLPDKTEEKPE